MDADLRELIQQIHAVPGMASLALAGGGASVAGWLLAVPGSSRTILEVAVPYASTALAEYLGHEPISYCSPVVVRAMALRARDRAAHLMDRPSSLDGRAAGFMPAVPDRRHKAGGSPVGSINRDEPCVPGDRIAGVACTASLRSDRPKRGEHRVYVASATEMGTIVQSLILAKEQRDRDGEEAVVARLTLNALAEAFGLTQRVALPLLPGESVQREEESAGLLARFLAGRPAAFCVEPDGRLREGGELPGVLLSGSFNPLHEGHRGMAEAAARVLDRSVAFELGVANAEKPSLTEGEVRRRMAQFAWQAPLWLTHAPTFLGKSRLFPGAVFVVGVDTAVRIIEPRFYGDSVEAMRAALAEIRRQGCRFLVAGRLAGEKFLELKEVEMAEEFRDLFTAIPAEMFRADISSTKLRSVQTRSGG